ncbi:MAG TPA: hypothetical protein VEX68_21645 [Bryobacteraceae bacterium]|nr:hypothetical protein [Bryobacteraceae bacterium]
MAFVAEVVGPLNASGELAACRVRGQSRYRVAIERDAVDIQDDDKVVRGICHEVIDGRGMRPARQYLPHLEIRGNESFQNKPLAGHDTVWNIVHVERYDNL